MAFSIPTTGFDFNSSLSPSERENAAEYFAGSNVARETLWEKADALDVDIVEAYSSDLDLGSILGLDSSQFLGGLAGPDPGWTFITAPEDISWTVNNSVSRVDIFGTNSPPVVAGTRGMRDLDLNNALVEGFVRGVTIEGKVAALENLLNYGLNSSDGFVSIPVYQVWANEKSYGGSQAYYVIESVKVKETMRDLTGNENIYFMHDRIRETFYERVTEEERIPLHKHIAEVMEEQNKNNIDTVLYELAYHFTKGEMESRPAAFRLAVSVPGARKGIGADSVNGRFGNASRRHCKPAAYPASLAAMAATCRPWKRAASSSFSLGMRSPEPPAMVEAPYGDPPVISSILV